MPAATLINAAPTVPAEPHDVPVLTDNTVVTRNDVIMIYFGLMICRPMYTRNGIVPLTIHAPIISPTQIRIRIAGNAAASFSTISFSISFQVYPRYIHRQIVKAAQISSRILISTLKTSSPTINTANIKISGSTARKNPGFFISLSLLFSICTPHTILRIRFCQAPVSSHRSDFPHPLSRSEVLRYFLSDHGMQVLHHSNYMYRQ